MSPKGNGEAVDMTGADVEFRVSRGKPCWVPLSAAGVAWLRLLENKESITQRDLVALGEAYSHGWVRDVRGWCDAPLALYPSYRPGLGRWTAYIVQCRHCEGCRRSRQADWASRAGLECAAAERTWFVTFTLGRKARRARQRAEAASAWEAAHVHPHLTRLFDALRHSHGTRYLLAEEYHKDGVAHWHALIHEGRRRLRYRKIAALWGLGFIEAHLVADRQHAEVAAYVAKYATKTQGRRIRASRKYGWTFGALINSPAKGQAEADGRSPEVGGVDFSLVEGID